MFIDLNATPPPQLRPEERNVTKPLLFKILSAPPNGAVGGGGSDAIDMSLPNGGKANGLCRR